MSVLRIILGDQLSLDISSLQDCNKSQDVILMGEVWQEATYVKHHVKKIAFIFSAMRHFAEGLTHNGYKVEYIKLDHQNKKTSFTHILKQALKQHKITKVIVTHPGEYRVLQEIKSWTELFNIALEIRDDDRFLCDIDEFKEWEQQYKQPRMEFFYRYMRIKHNVLLKNNKPVGGKWNFDQENRKSIDKNIKVNNVIKFTPDNITKDVLGLVAKYFNKHFGNLDDFYFAVTRNDAKKFLSYFINNNLQFFGDYQDAMLEDEPFLYHSHISHYINIGLLSPLECIVAAEDAYYSNNNLRLNNVEGFIRQVLGWREYIRGVYWHKMPNYDEQNFLAATKKLPEFFWTGDTKMNCMQQCIKDTAQNAYAHHIQRLMVLGNFCLLTGIDPKYVNEWYLIVYADAYQWVELPNVTGMVLYADGGYVASKPYAASGNYINKMSNYCKNCSYNVKEKHGDTACPFNYLYWNFFINNQKFFKNNPRLLMVYSTLGRMDKANLSAIKKSSEKFIATQLL